MSKNLYWMRNFSVKSSRDSLADVEDDRSEHRYNEEGDDDHSSDHALLLTVLWETEQMEVLTSAALVVRTAATGQDRGFKQSMA